MHLTCAAAIIAAVILAPAAGHATVYRMDAMVNGRPEVFGRFSVDPTVVSGRELNIARSCPQFFPCFQDGPWDQVSFNLIGPLQLAVEQTAPGTIDRFRLMFAASGDVIGGQILIEGAENTPAAQLLRASLGSWDGCTGTTLCGIYLRAPIEDPLPVSITFVQEPKYVSEPTLGWPLLLAGIVGLPWLARVRGLAQSSGPV